MIFAGRKILDGLCNTGARREVYMNLMPPQRPNLRLFSYFVSSGRLMVEGLRAFQSQFFMLNHKKVIQDVIFTRKVLKTKWLMYIGLGLHIFYKFFFIMITPLSIFTRLEVFSCPSRQK